MPELDSKALITLLGTSGESDREKLLREALADALLKLKTPATPDRLKEFYRSYTKTYDFKAGDLVQWKAGLKDRKVPLEGEPAIVVEVLDKPVYDEAHDAGSPYFREPYDIILGVIHQDNSFVTYHFNSRRFEPYKG